MARDVYIVRHGNTFDRGQTVTRVGARTDLALSRSGEAQADQLAAHFADTGIAFSRVWASPLKRTQQTATRILSRQPAAPVIETRAFLREIDYGPDENQPEAAVVARLGEAAIASWDSEAIVPDGWLVDPTALKQQWQEAFDTLAADADDAPALVVTSNGIARFALQVAVADGDHALKLGTGAFGILQVATGTPAKVKAWNVRP